MPGSVQSAAPSEVMPVTLSLSFAESRAYMVDENRYRNGESQRRARTATSRKRFSLAKRLTPADLDILRGFWLAVKHGPFYFYNPFETDPKFTLTPTGTTGRYTVRFDGEWPETGGFPRSEVEVTLVELA